MSVVRRGSAVSVAGVAVAGAVLLGGPAWAQEAPPDYDPVIAESGAVSDTGTVGMDPDAPVDDTSGGGGPCTSVSPDGGLPVDEGIAVGEPAPDGSDATVPAEGEAKPGAEPAADEPLADESVSSEPVGSTDDPLICAFGVPAGAPEVTGGGGGTQVDAAAAELPRTGSPERLLGLTAIGAGLVVAGAGATVAGRRRRA
jgi:LPXTG-motif cell wall-anchored protein